MKVVVLIKKTVGAGVVIVALSLLFFKEEKNSSNDAQKVQKNFYVGRSDNTVIEGKASQKDIQKHTETLTKTPLTHNPIEAIISKLDKQKKSNEKLLQKEKQRFEAYKKSMIALQRRKAMTIAYAKMRQGYIKKIKNEHYKRRFLRLQKGQIAAQRVMMQKNINTMKGERLMVQNYKKMTQKAQINAQIKKGGNHEK